MGRPFLQRWLGQAIGRAVVVGAAVFSLQAPAVAQQSMSDSARGAALERTVPDSVRTVTLEQAVTSALERNRELADARLGVDDAEEQVQEAWGSIYPNVTADASYTRNVSPQVNFLPASIFDPSAGPDELIPVQFGAANTWSMQIRVEQPIFQAGAFMGLSAAGSFEALQEEVLRGTAQQIATRTRIAYYDVLLAAEAQRLSENSVRRIRQTLEETRALHRAGLTSEYDVLRLEVELANNEPNLRQTENELAAARRQLAIEMGWDEGQPPRVMGSLLRVDLDRVAGGNGPPGTASQTGADTLGATTAPVLAFASVADRAARAGLEDAEIVQVALSRRSDLRQLQLTAELRETELRVEQSEYLPELSLFGTYTISAQGNGDPTFFGGDTGQRAYGRQVGLQVSIPLFTGFQRPARVGQRRVGVRRAEVQYRLARDQTENEIQTLLDQMREAHARAEAQQLAVGQAQRGFEIASAQYRAGLGSQIQVTDAEVALRQSEYNYAQAVYDYLVARARLDEAVGMVPLVDTDDAIALER